MKIGIYGGTFDPPHVGHMEAARAAMSILELDKLLFIPSKIPPHKVLPKAAAAPDDRLAMTALMADGLGPSAEVLDLELKRDGKSYTVDTLEELRMQYPQDELWLLMGTDMFLTLQNWREPERILKLAGVVGFARTEEECGELFDTQSEYLRTTYGAQVCTVQLPRITDISSTRLRTALQGAGVAAMHYLWPPVYGYILRKGLYGTHADLKKLTVPQLRAVSSSMVKAKRLAHIKGTEETAIKLAEHWGADPELAQHAAILHDCTKYLTLPEQLEICEQYGIELDELERVGVKFLHAKTGAALARHVFGEPDEVYDAIFCHTTGKQNMSTLEKIIYLSDYMEPNRVFEGVEELRALVWKDLDRAMIWGLEATIKELEEKSAPVHQNTLLTLQELKGREA